MKRSNKLMILSILCVLQILHGDGLQNIAQSIYGTRAIGSGAPFNKDWPASRAIRQESIKRGGTIFGNPMEGGRIDIILPFELEVKELELIPLNYRGTSTPKTCDIYIDGEMFKSVELPDSFDAFKVSINKRATEIGVTTTSIYKKKVLWGGWNRIRVMSDFDIEATLRPIDAYNVPVSVSNIAVVEQKNEATVVYGKPRVSQGHPCTIWDKEDIAHYKKMITESPELAMQYKKLLSSMDVRIQKPVEVPQPVKNEKGEWVHVSASKTGKIHNALALDIANLGTAYVLSGEDKYGEYAKRLLLAYADAYPNYGVGARPGFKHDPSKVFDQRLGDATWLIQLARGYDLIYNLPSITPEERKHIEDDLIKASGKFIAANRHVLNGPTNWSAISTAAVLIAGVATDDEWLFNRAMYGINSDSNPKQWWTGEEGNKRPSGIELHFSDRTIDIDGMWSEGAMGYQFMAMEALITDAEILWHKGIDMYGYRNAALKRLFDSPLKYAYPDLRSPSINDSGSVSIVGRDAFLYEFAYRRYKDPQYIPILQRSGKHLAASFQQWVVSILYDLNLDDMNDFAKPESVNMNGVGYGILRLTDKQGTQSLLMDYGPNRSHGHPDKLNIDLWSKGERLLPDPGIVWYENPLYVRWYKTTMAHNTLSVNELSQQGAKADLLTYLPGETIAYQRASCTEAYPGVVMDRSVFLTPKYLADIFGAFSRLPKLYDLCWHIIADQFECDLEFEAYKFQEPVQLGYNELKSPRAGIVKKPYKSIFRSEHRESSLYSGASDETTVIAGEGYFGRMRPTAVLQRRKTANTLYFNVLDISDDNYVQGIDYKGSVEDGYGMLLINTLDGRDVCFTAYSNRNYRLKPIQTDALQAMVTRKDKQVTSISFTGGTYLQVKGFSIKLQKKGIVLLEKLPNGSYMIQNPTTNAANIEINSPQMKDIELSYLCTKAGKRNKRHETDFSGKEVRLELPALSRVELAKADSESPYEYNQRLFKERADAEKAKLKKKNLETRQRADKRLVESQQKPVPANTVIEIQAEDFIKETGGKAYITSNKVASVGASIVGWNNDGHSFEWKVNIPNAGYYNVSYLYCAESGTARRILVNGESPEPEVTENIELKPTGGWARSSDDWKLYTIMHPLTAKPLLIYFKQGENIIKMENTVGGGANLDYILITSPDVKPERIKVK